MTIIVYIWIILLFLGLKFCYFLLLRKMGFFFFLMWDPLKLAQDTDFLGPKGQIPYLGKILAFYYCLWIYNLSLQNSNFNYNSSLFPNKKKEYNSSFSKSSSFKMCPDTADLAFLN